MSWSDLGGVASAVAEGFCPLPAEQVASRPGADALFPDLCARPSAAVASDADEVASGADAEPAVDPLREAYERGHAEGRAAAAAELVEASRGCVAALAEITRFRAAMIEREQAALVELAFAIAGKIVRVELAERPERWLAMIRAGVQHALTRESIRLRVGPALHEYLAAHAAELRAQLEGVRDFELIDDPALPDTGCTIETAFGDVDVGVAEQLGTVKSALAEDA